MLGVQSVSATNPSLQLNADGTAFDVTPGQQGTGIDVTDIVKEAKNVLESFGKQTAQMVTLKIRLLIPSSRMTKPTRPRLLLTRG